MSNRVSIAHGLLIGGMALGLLNACQTSSGGGRAPSGGGQASHYSASEMASFPYDPGPSACEAGARPLSRAVVGPGWLRFLTPLGNLHPPEHTLPTSHMYLHGSGGATVRAPGDVRLVRISQTIDLTTGRGDYGLTFQVCRGVLLYFLHIGSVPPEVERAAAAGDCQEYGGGGDGHRYRYCETRAGIAFAAGQEIGRVEDGHTFDLGAYRSPGPSPAYVDPSLYGNRLPNIVCPLDLFSGNAGRALYAKVDRKHPPRCGVDAQDVGGTLAGNWFQGNARADRFDDNDRHLAFVADNVDPTVAVISVGGTVTDPGSMRFLPQSQGRNNRAFRDVTPGSGLFCFEGTGLGGRIIAELTAARRLLVEHQSGGCGGDPAFENPARYNR